MAIEDKGIVAAYEELNEEDQEYVLDQIDLLLEVIDEEEEKILDFLDREESRKNRLSGEYKMKPTIN